MDQMNKIKAEALAREAERRLGEGGIHEASSLAAKALALNPEQPTAQALLERLKVSQSPIYSVVIPTCNRLDILKLCLRRLEEQTLPLSDFEVLVVDDASMDGTVDFLTNYNSPLTFRAIFMPLRGGPARARNAGVRAASGEVVHFLNDDALIEPQVLAIHSSLHRALADTPVSVLGRFDFGPPFTETLWGYTLENSDLLFRYPTFTHNGLHGFDAYYSCNISTPRGTLIKAGLFDEAFTGKLWGAEDREFGMRLAAMSVPVLFRDDSRSTHVHDVGVEGLARTALVRGGGAVWLFAKHGGRPHYASIRARDVAYWRNLPTRLTERVSELHKTLSRSEVMRPVSDGTPTPYLHRDNYEKMHHLCLSLWHMRTRELLDAIVEVEKIAVQAIHATDHGESLQFCARILYPAMLFIRFFHDTIGVCSVDSIREFCPDAPPMGI